MILPQSTSVLLRRVWCSKFSLDSFIFQEGLQSFCSVFPSSIRSDPFGCFAKFSLHMSDIFFYLFRHFRLLTQQVHLSIPARVINDGNEIPFPPWSCSLHWATDICMNQVQNFICL